MTDDTLKIDRDLLLRLAWRAKDLAAGMQKRADRLPDKADFLAAFEHELFGTDEKKGRRAESRAESTEKNI